MSSADPTIFSGRLPDTSPHSHLVDGDSPVKTADVLPETLSNMYNGFSNMLNGAFQRMTETLGSMFQNTIQEVNREKENKVSDSNVQENNSKTLSRTRVMRRESRRRLSSPLRDSESETDNESQNSGNTVSTSHIFSKRNTSNSVSVKLPAFKGESDEKWKAYINRFEAVATHNGWTDKEKLGQLLPRLQGKAGEFTFEELSSETLSNYKKLTKEIENRFGVIESNRTYQTKFRRRDQKNGEHIQNYASELKRLYSKAYPSRDRLTKQEDLVSRFLLGLLNEKARLHVELNRDPRTIEEATEYVIEYEEATKYPKAEEYSYEARRKPTRQVKDSALDNKGKLSTSGWSQSKGKKEHEQRNEKATGFSNKNTMSQQSKYITQDDLKDVISQVLQSVQQQNYGYKNDQKKSIICYRCGEPGHYANSCVNEKANKSAQSSKALSPNAQVFMPSLN